MPKTNPAWLIGSVTSAMLASFYVGRSHADGVPEKNALSYAGQLEEIDGTPVTGPHSLRVQFWLAAEGGDKPVCETLSKRIELLSGRFSVPVPDECVDAVRANRDVWAAVELDGVGLGRSKFGAVPFAIVAREATAASGALAQQVVPPGAVMAFDLDACPPGWSEFTAAQGRAVIGTQPDVARGTQLGADGFELKVEHMPSHSHAGVTQGGNAIAYRLVHQPGARTASNHVAAWGNGDYTDFNDTNYSTSQHTHNFVTDAAGSGEAFDNRQASLALLYCRKD